MLNVRSMWIGLSVVACFAGGWSSPYKSDATVAPCAEPVVVQCEGAVQHPLEVRLTALDPIRRGEIVRVRVTTTARRGLERASANLVSAGGATPIGATSTRLGRLAAGRSAISQFAVRLPSSGHRFLLQVRVTGEGEGGIATRGAALNLLPDGPSTGRSVVLGDGRVVVESAARRIGE